MKPRLYLETIIPHLLASDIIPAVAEDDAVHIGLAAAHGMDYLLTWNCRHINNHHLRGRIEQACAAFDLGCPDICTPATSKVPGRARKSRDQRHRPPPQRRGHGDPLH